MQHIQHAQGGECNVDLCPCQRYIAFAETTDIAAHMQCHEAIGPFHASLARPLVRANFLSGQLTTNSSKDRMLQISQCRLRQYQHDVINVNMSRRPYAF